jgi:hypothetical protein
MTAIADIDAVKTGHGVEILLPVLVHHGAPSPLPDNQGRFLFKGAVLEERVPEVLPVSGI